MKPICVGVWIDHASARIVRLSDGQSACATRFSQVEPGHRSTGHWGVAPPGRIGGNPAWHYQNRREEQLRKFYDQIIGDLKNCDAVLLMGPGEAKRELLDRMREKGSLRSSRLQIETASRLTDRQLVVRVQRFAESASP